MVQEAARGSVRIDAHAPPTTWPGHRSSGLPAMRFAISLCRGADISRPRARRSGCGIALCCGIPVDRASRPAVHFVVKQIGGRELVQRSSRNLPIGQGIGLAGRLSVSAGLCTVSPSSPPIARGETVLHGSEEPVRLHDSIHIG
jgi:hypothetical protein